MIVTNEEIILTAEQREQIFWESWTFDSHKWLEYQKGYFACDFCGAIHTSMMPISNQKLCLKNPIIKNQNEKTN